MLAYREIVDGPLSKTECETLSIFAQMHNGDHALEVGHFLGLSTIVLLDSLLGHVSLTTIDHHEGDDWAGSTSHDEFIKNVMPFVGDRVFFQYQYDMCDLRSYHNGGYDFVFYDADHHAVAIADWWKMVRGRLRMDCTLIFDDADWAPQSVLFGLAYDDGFRSVRDWELTRLPGDKTNPKTMTLEVMKRGRDL